MTDRGAAAGENGRVNMMNALGPNAGNNSGIPLIHAAREITKIAEAPFNAATMEITFRSFIDDRSTGMLSHALSIRQRIRNEI